MGIGKIIFSIGVLLIGFSLPNIIPAHAVIDGCVFDKARGGDYCPPDDMGPTLHEYCAGQPTPEKPDCCCTYQAMLKINSQYDNEGNKIGTTAEKKQILPSVFGVPELKVSIPGLDKFQPATCMPGEDCSIPWLSQYIAGLQRYAVGIVSLLAVIVIMIGGVIWLTSGGNQSRIGEAKKLISGGIGGVILTIGAYFLLYTINPDLTVLKSINISYIGKIDLETLILENHDPAFDAANGKPITDTTYDDTFKSFAGCIGIDWRVLKGIAFKESHLDAGVVNSAGFIGLFQTKEKYCVESVRQIGLSSSFCSAGVKDPAVNTAVASGMMKVNLKTVNSKCGSSSDSVKMFMLYYGHSSGGGALKNAINNYGCNVSSWPDSIFKGAKKKYVTETVETILAQGVTTLNNTAENKTCPQG